MPSGTRSPRPPPKVPRSERETERILLAAARVGQHVFALNVLANCGRRCVFCGLNPGSFGAKRMLLAGHIRPWKDSTSAERLDLRNGLAACPSHDVAFDTGLLTVRRRPRIHLSSGVADAVRGDPSSQAILRAAAASREGAAPGPAELPARKYLDWHQEQHLRCLISPAHLRIEHPSDGRRVQPGGPGAPFGPGWRGSPAARMSRSRWRGAPGGGMSRCAVRRCYPCGGERPSPPACRSRPV